MDKQIKKYDENKQGIKKYVEHLDGECKKFYGNNNYYKPSVDNVYKEFIDVEDFKKRGVGKMTERTHLDRHCKYVSFVSPAKDKNNRYFRNAHNKLECDRVKGVWDPKALNRKNKYDTGVCWVTPEDKACSDEYDGSLLRPNQTKFQNIKSALKNKSVTCELNPKCQWKQETAFTYDCEKRENPIFEKQESPKEESAINGPVMKPHKKMPLTNDDLEEFLYDWYAGKKYGKSPETAKLLGKGNRCARPPPPPQPADIKAESIKVLPQSATNEIVPYIDYRNLDPYKEADSKLLIQAMNKNWKLFDKYKDEWREIQKYGYPQFLRLSKNAKIFAPHFYEKMDQLQFESDRALVLAPPASKKIETPPPESIEDIPGKWLPSVPQSVMNMVMKNVAIHNTPKRGMLAWHSTGSGKTATAVGIMDAFWDTDRTIIFASSIDAIASNPPRTFWEMAYKLFPRFQQSEFQGASENASIDLIGQAFNKRRVRYLSFAKLSNRVVKTLEYKKKYKLKGGGKKKVSKKSKKNDKEDDDEKPKKKKKVSKKSKKSDSDDDDEKPKKKKKVSKKSKKNEDDSEDEKPKKKKKVSKKSKKNEDDSEDEKPKKKKKASKKSKKNDDESDDEKPKKKKVSKKSKKNDNDENGHDKMLKNPAFADLDNAILIIDEVHNLFRPLANQKKQHALLEKEIIDPKKHPNLKIVILTATPGDNVPDVIKLLNCVRDVSEDPIEAPDMDSASEITAFKQSIRGLVSYFDMSGDTTKFPVVIDDESSFIRVPMGLKQFEKYAEAYHKVTAFQKDYPALAKANQVGKYWEPVRKYANSMWNFEKNMQLSDFSAKMPHLIERVIKLPQEKHYIYSAFYTNVGYGGQGVLAIAKELVKQGYVQITVAEAKKYTKKDKDGKDVVTMPPKAKRFFLAITTQLEGTDPGKALKYLINIYNHDENKHGEFIHVMLASQKFNESLDLKAVANIHFFEPLITMASDKQTIGRAARTCSFAALDREKGEWKVKIHRYMNQKPLTLSNNKDVEKTALVEEINSLEAELEDDKKNKELKKSLADKKKELKALSKPSKTDYSKVEMIEQKIYDESRERFREILTVYQCMREAAVDCRLMKKFHASVTTNGVQCEF